MWFYETVSEECEDVSSRKWVLAFMPVSILHNFLAGGYRLAPYPVPVGGTGWYVLFWIVYIVIGMMAELIICRSDL